MSECVKGKTVQVTVSLPKLPEGWEYTGEYRSPNIGEYFFVPKHTSVVLNQTRGCGARWIIRKVKWVPALYDCFYYLTEVGSIPSRTNYDSGYDRALFNSNNFFKTREKAEEARDTLLKTLRSLSNV